MSTIHEIRLNNKNEVVGTIYKYLDTDSMCDTISALLLKEYEDFLNCLENPMGWSLDEDYIEEYTNDLVARFNRDMRKYLHMEDRKICGNFNNIEYDYPKMLYDATDGQRGTDTFSYDSDLLNAMISRLDSGEDSAEADIDRKILTDWFFGTVGTWGICYNFTDYLDADYHDWCYCYAEECA